jgi:hypothetical protein
LRGSGQVFDEIRGRFRLAEPGGLVPVSDEAPSEPSTRPFGLRFAVRPQVTECAKHKRDPTRETKTKPTQYSKDSKLVRDTESYVQYD